MQLSPLARRAEDLARERGIADRYLDAATLVAPGRVARALVVDARGARDACRRPIEHEVRQQRVAAEVADHVALAVAPGAELLEQPRGQPGGRVRLRNSERVGLGPLEARVGVLVCAPEAVLLDRRRVLGPSVRRQRSDQ